MYNQDCQKLGKNGDNIRKVETLDLYFDARKLLMNHDVESIQT